MKKFQKNNFTLILFNLGGRRFHPENRLVQIYLEYYKEVTYFVLNLFDDSKLKIQQNIKNVLYE